MNTNECLCIHVYVIYIHIYIYIYIHTYATPCCELRLPVTLHGQLEGQRVSDEHSGPFTDSRPLTCNSPNILVLNAGPRPPECRLLWGVGLT